MPAADTKGSAIVATPSKCSTLTACTSPKVKDSSKNNADCTGTTCTAAADTVTCCKAPPAIGTSVATPSPTPSSVDDDNDNMIMLGAIAVVVVVAVIALGGFFAYSRRSRDAPSAQATADHHGGKEQDDFDTEWESELNAGMPRSTPPRRPRSVTAGLTLTRRQVDGIEPHITQHVQEAFARYDIDNSGTISKEEALSMVQNMGLNVSRGYIDGVWGVYDANGDGVLDMQEFSRFLTVLDRKSSNVAMSPSNSARTGPRRPTTPERQRQAGATPLPPSGQMSDYV